MVSQFMQFRQEFSEYPFEIVTIDNDGGTADAIRQIRDKITVRRWTHSAQRVPSACQTR